MKRGDWVVLSEAGIRYYGKDPGDPRAIMETKPAMVLSHEGDNLIVSLSGNDYDGWTRDPKSGHICPPGAGPDVQFLFADKAKRATSPQEVDDAIASIMHTLSTRGGAK